MRKNKVRLIIAGIGVTAASFGVAACHSGDSALAICVDSKPISNIGVTYAQYKAGTNRQWAICAGDNNSAQCGWEGKYSEDPHKSYNVHCNFPNGVDPNTFAQAG
jgi:hypothetical protein